MRRPFAVCLALAGTLAPCVAATVPLAPEDVASMNAAIGTLREATLAGDFAAIAGQMHPRLIAEMGGVDAARGMIAASYEEMQRAGFRIESWSADPPADAHATEGDLVVIVPMFLALVSGEARISSTGYLVASRPKAGGPWVFIDGSALTDRRALDLLFPGLPADFVLPEKKQFTTRLDGGATNP